MSERLFLLEIEAAPDGYSERELLEMALAAASMDLDLALLFTGPGLGHLVGEAARGWRQLVDHELARLYCRPGSETEISIMPGVTVLDLDAEAGLRSGRRLLRVSG
ncbi:MAG: hypothetical protein EA370_08670 [Wenzhouxiangella sp.]|nr:MAG: hypothetical protein EA370_08670 [Wenzhouxiangella sp.]